jgi:hypothetical protein
MSTTSPPNYAAPPAPALLRAPTYTNEPGAEEQRLAFTERPLHVRLDGNFVKQAKNGGVSLRLTQQINGAELPLYGHGAAVEGSVDIPQADNVDSVEVKVCDIFAD